MFKRVKEFFKSAWEWIQAVWDKHDDQIESIVAAVLPMVIAMAFRGDLSGSQKRQAIVDAIIDNAEASADAIATSVINEAVEIAANKYKIQLGTLTVEGLDAAADAAIKAGRDFANKTLNLTGTEAEAAETPSPEAEANADPLTELLEQN